MDGSFRVSEKVAAVTIGDAEWWPEATVRGSAGQSVAVGESWWAEVTRVIVTVTRSGGFAGLVRTAELDTAAAPDGDRVEQAVRRLDPARVPSSGPQRDRYVYRLQVPGAEMTVAEQDLEAELAWLVERVLQKD
jgi:Emfourin